MRVRFGVCVDRGVIRFKGMPLAGDGILVVLMFCIVRLIAMVRRLRCNFIYPANLSSPQNWCLSGITLAHS